MKMLTVNSLRSNIYNNVVDRENILFYFIFFPLIFHANLPFQTPASRPERPRWRRLSE